MKIDRTYGFMAMFWAVIGWPSAVLIYMSTRDLTNKDHGEILYNTLPSLILVSSCFCISVIIMSLAIVKKFNQYNVYQITIFSSVILVIAIEFIGIFVNSSSFNDYKSTIFTGPCLSAIYFGVISIFDKVFRVAFNRK